MHKVTLIQMDIAWGDIDANCKRAMRFISEHPGSDLYILPEMFSTGFSTDPSDVSDTEGKSLRWMQHAARTADAAICGSVATLCDDRLFRNRMYFVKPDGSHIHYDKHHLFTYGGEDTHYTPGQERVVTLWRGIRYLMQICYDLRFPVFARNHGDYDAIIYTASWPASRSHVWNTLLAARAIENQCHVLGVNRVSQDKACTYQGDTHHIDAYGRIVDSCPTGEESAITTAIDLEALEAFRRKFPVLKDADHSLL